LISFLVTTKMYRYQPAIPGLRPFKAEGILRGEALYWKWIQILTTPMARIEPDPAKASSERNPQNHACEEKKDDEQFFFSDNCGDSDDDLSCVSSIADADDDNLVSDEKTVVQNQMLLQKISDLSKKVDEQSVLLQEARDEIKKLTMAMERKDKELEHQKRLLETEVAAKERLALAQVEERERAKKKNQSHLESQSEMEKEFLNEIVKVAAQLKEAEEKHRHELDESARIHREEIAAKEMEVSKLTEEIRHLMSSNNASSLTHASEENQSEKALQKLQDEMEQWKQAYAKELAETAKADERTRLAELEKWKRTYSKEMSEKVLEIASLKQELHRMKEQNGQLPSSSMSFSRLSNIGKKTGF